MNYYDARNGQSGEITPAEREAMQDELLSLEPPEASDDPAYARRRIAEIHAILDA